MAAGTQATTSALAAGVAAPMVVGCASIALSAREVIISSEK
jgi:hypothetical protein